MPFVALPKQGDLGPLIAPAGDFHADLAGHAQLGRSPARAMDSCRSLIPPCFIHLERIFFHDLFLVFHCAQSPWLCRFAQLLLCQFSRFLFASCSLQCVYMGKVHILYLVSFFQISLELACSKTPRPPRGKRFFDSEETRRDFSIERNEQNPPSQDEFIQACDSDWDRMNPLIFLFGPSFQM